MRKRTQVLTLVMLERGYPKASIEPVGLKRDDIPQVKPDQNPEPTSDNHEDRRINVVKVDSASHDLVGYRMNGGKIEATRATAMANFSFNPSFLAISQRISGQETERRV